MLSEKVAQFCPMRKQAKMQLMEIGSTAGGARAKATVAWNEKTGEVRSGQIDA